MHKHFSCPYYQHPQKNKEPSVTSNVPKALNFYGFTPILFFLFVSIKRVLFRECFQESSSPPGHGKLSACLCRIPYENGS